jgi:hypothetical protein
MEGPGGKTQVIAEELPPIATILAQDSIRRDIVAGDISILAQESVRRDILAGDVT